MNNLSIFEEKHKLINDLFIAFLKRNVSIIFSFVHKVIKCEIFRLTKLYKRVLCLNFIVTQIIWLKRVFWNVWLNFNEVLTDWFSWFFSKFRKVYFFINNVRCKYKLVYVFLNFWIWSTWVVISFIATFYKSNRNKWRIVLKLLSFYFQTIIIVYA